MNEDDPVQVLVDPLILLKDAITRGKFGEIVRVENEFLFNFYNCALNFQTPTRCRNRRGESLNLDDLHLFITFTKNKKYTMKLAQDHGSKFINILEKKNILEFLEEFVSNSSTKNEGIPSNYSLEDLSKFECINSEFSLQPCRLIDCKINKITHLNSPWVEYKRKSEEISSSIVKEHKDLDTITKDERKFEADTKEETMLNRKQFNTISQIYPINVDYICQGIDMYSRINTLVTFMNEPGRNDNKKRDLSSGSNTKSSELKRKIHNTGDNHSNNSSIISSSAGLSNNTLSRSRTVPKSVNSQQSRSTLLAYLNSNNLNPIILVPPSSKSPITMNNVVQFLRDKVFIDPNTTNRSFVGNEQTITLNFGSGPTAQKVTFRILESTLNFRKRDWYSLIAVFLTGAEWQLQSFPFKSIPDIFTMIKGYHITYDSEPIPENIRKWNVDVVRINRTNRHNDLSVWFQFMESIESVLASSRDHSKLDRSKL